LGKKFLKLFRGKFHFFPNIVGGKIFRGIFPKIFPEKCTKNWPLVLSFNFFLFLQRTSGSDCGRLDAVRKIYLTNAKAQGSILLNLNFGFRTHIHFYIKIAIRCKSKRQKRE
jgi:hypothetical protein